MTEYRCPHCEEIVDEDELTQVYIYTIEIEENATRTRTFDIKAESEGEAKDSLEAYITGGQGRDDVEETDEGNWETNNEYEVQNIT